MQQLRSGGAALLASLRRSAIRVSANTTIRLSALALLTIGIVVACDRVPLTSPTGSTISLSIDRNVLPVNGQATVTAVVTESSGTPVHNGTTVTFQTSLGRIEPLEAQTSNGKAVVTFLAGGSSGTAAIHAFSGGARTGSGNSSAGGVEVKIGTAAAERVTVRTEPLNIPATGGTVSVVASLFDVSGNAISNTPIAISSDFGSLSSNSAVTNENGEARVSLTTNRTTRITATAGAKSGEYTLSALSPPSVTLTCAGSPNAAVGVPVSCTIGATPGAGNTSSSAPILNVTINWGDNSGETPVGVNTSTTVSHIYNNPGTFVVTAAATDANSQRGQAVLTLNVQRVLPTVTLAGLPTTPVVAGSTVSGTVAAAAGTGGAPIQSVQVSQGGVILFSGTGNGSFTRQMNSPGSFTFLATARDTAGNEGSATAVVVVTARPAIEMTLDAAVSGGPAATCSGTYPKSCTGFTTGNQVIFNAGFSGTAPANITGYSWNFGDGTSANTTNRNTDHKFTAPGSYVITVTVTTSDGGSGSQFITINVS